MRKGRKAAARTSAAVHRKPAPVPWWFGGNDEECPHCGAGYAYEVEVRCADCDEATCALCAVRLQGRVVCPDCLPAKAHR